MCNIHTFYVNPIRRKRKTEKWKSMHELSETPCYYLVVGPLSKLSSYGGAKTKNMYFCNLSLNFLIPDLELMWRKRIFWFCIRHKHSQYHTRKRAFTVFWIIYPRLDHSHTPTSKAEESVLIFFIYGPGARKVQLDQDIELD